MPTLSGKTPHGTANGYVNYGCRCTACTTANTRSKQECDKKRSQRSFWEIPHGTRNGYNNYSCRCNKCRAAAREYQRKRRIND